MTINTKLETLKQQYFDLSREFLTALQDNRPSEELEVIRRQIRLLVSEMDALETENKEATD
jgi:hypothetical protein